MWSHKTHASSWLVQLIHLINPDLVLTIWLVPDPAYTWRRQGRIFVFKKLPVLYIDVIVKQVTSFNSFASSPATPFLKIPTAVSFKCLQSLYSYHSHAFLSHAFVLVCKAGPTFCHQTRASLSSRALPRCHLQAASSETLRTLGIPCTLHVNYLFLCLSPTLGCES